MLKLHDKAKTHISYSASSHFIKSLNSAGFHSGESSCGSSGPRKHRGTTVSLAAYCQLKNIRSTKSLSQEALAAVVRAFLHRAYERTKCRENPLQRIQNSSARLISSNSVLQKWHWLPVK